MIRVNFMLTSLRCHSSIDARCLVPLADGSKAHLGSTVGPVTNGAAVLLTKPIVSIPAVGAIEFNTLLRGVCSSTFRFTKSTHVTPAGY